MGRRTAIYQTSGGSSGGGEPVVGNVIWGPKFGGTDGDEWTAGAAVDLQAVNPTASKTCGCQIDLEKVDAVFAKTIGISQTLGIGYTFAPIGCGCSVDLDKVDLSHDKLIGCQVDLDALAFTFSKSVGCAVDLEKVDITGDKSVGVRADGNVSFPLSQNVGATVDLDKVNLSHDKTCGIDVTATYLGAPLWISATINSNDGTTGTTSGTVNYPSGIQSGDLLVLAVHTNASGANPTAPTGFAFWPSTSVVAGGNVKLGVFYRIADGTESGSLTVPYSGVNSMYVAQMHLIRAVDTVNPSNDVDWSSASVTDPVVPAGTSTVNNVLNLLFISHDHTLAGSHTAPASYSERTELTATPSLGGPTAISGSSYTRPQNAIGSSGTSTVDCSNLVASQAAYMRLMIKPGVLSIA